MRVLLGLSHLYMVLTFKIWSARPASFSAAGLEQCVALPIPHLGWLPRLSEPQVTLALALLALAALGGMLLSYREPEDSWALLGLLVMAKLYFYLLDLRLMTTYHHMHLILCCLLLLPRDRLICLRLGMASIYLGAAFGKYTDSWLEARYFLSIQDGLPLLGKAAPVLLLASWAVVLLESVGPLLLLWPDRRVSLPTVYLFLTFHLYSTLIVGFFYPTLMGGALVALFLPWERPIPAPLDLHRSHLAAMAVILLTLGGSVVPHLLPGDVRLNSAGKYLGVANMFDANHALRFELVMEKSGQVWRVIVFRRYPERGFYRSSNRVLVSRGREAPKLLLEPLEIQPGTRINPELFISSNLRTIGDPYLYLYFTESLIGALKPERFHFTLDHGLNRQGSPVRVLEGSRLEDFHR